MGGTYRDTVVEARSADRNTGAADTGQANNSHVRPPTTPLDSLLGVRALTCRSGEKEARTWT